MATLERPGVEVIQQITAGAPTITEPTLNPCLVGPCFAIMSPFTATGAVNAEAEVAIPAIVKSTAKMGTSVTAASKVLAIEVNGTLYVFELPASVSGAIPTSMLPATIMEKTKSNTSVKLVDEKLVIQTKTIGDSASLRLHSRSELIANGVPGITADTNMAYADLNLDTQLDSTLKGQGPYTNSSYLIPYAMLPTSANHPSGSEMVFEAEETDLYVVFDGKSRLLQDDAAIGWTAFVSAATNIDDTSFAANAGYPLSVHKTALYPKKKVGTKTNQVYSAGTNASVFIPLAHDASTTPNNDDRAWPDAGLQYYLYAEANGSQGLIAGTATVAGGYAGDSGNALSVEFKHNAQAGANPSIEISGTNIEIVYKGDAHTYAQLDAAIKAADLSGLFHTFSLVFPTGKGSNKLAAAADDVTDLVGGATTAKYFLSGGIDPVNFGTDGTATSAKIVSSISGMDAACAAVQGKEFTISVDGEEPKAVTVGANLAATAAAISAALGNDKIAVATDAPIRSKHEKTGSSATTLSIATVSTNGPDSTLQLGGDQDVIRELFAGFTTKTETGISENATGGKAEIALAQGTDYNKSAGTALEKAVKQGSVTVDITSGLTLVGYVASPVTNGGGDSAKNYRVKFKHSAFKPKTGTALTTEGTYSIARVNNKATLTGVGTDFGNEAGVANGEKMLIDGVELTIQGISNQVITFTVDWPAALATGVVKSVLKTSVDGVLGAETTTPAFAGAASANGFGGAINAALATVTAASAGSAAIADCLQAVEMEASAGAAEKTVVMVNKELTSGSSFTLVSDSTDTETTNFQEALEGTGTAATGAFDSPQVNVAGTCSVVHTPSNAGLPMTATPSKVFPGPANFSILHNDGAKISDIQTGSGAVAIFLEPELHAASTMSLDITYTRGAANHIDIQAADYSIVVSGASKKVISGDRLFNSGSVLSPIVRVDNNNVKGNEPAWGNSSILTLSTEAVETSTSSLGAWYIYQENLAADGTGRLKPEVMFNDTTQEASVKGSLIRSDAGIPIAGSAQLLAGYKALRKDVTADAVTPGLLVFNDATEVETLIGPIQPDNPLAFGLFLGFLNSPTSSLRAMGVGETTANAPDGTVKGYMKAFDFLQLHEVYALAPLTHSTSVHQLLSAHVTAMSAAEQKKERIGLICPTLPTEKLPTIATSAPGCTAEKQAAGQWHLDFGPNVNLVTALDGLKDANGKTISATTSSTHTADQGIFITRAGDPFKYIVDKIVNSSTVRFRTNLTFDSGKGPGSGGNDDAYYKNDSSNPAVIDGDITANFNAAGELCVLNVRNVAVDGSTTAGKLQQCEVLAEIAGGPSGYQNRRLVMIQPQQCTTMFDGLETVIPGYYLAGAIAAMIGQYNPSQPFTNFPMVGFVRPLGSSDIFTENQMATAAAGGVYWVIQDVTGAPLVSRHQLTTDLTSIKTRELSVTKAVDFVAKQLRQAVRRFIGRNNITQGLLDQIGLVLSGNLKSLAGDVVNTASLDSLVVDSSAPDKIAVQVSLVPFYPANKITITIVV